MNYFSWYWRHFAAGAHLARRAARVRRINADASAAHTAFQLGMLEQRFTDDGATPLCIACQNGHGSIVEALLGREAEVNQAKTDTGATPLYKACEQHHTS
jgi:ankyrin repeat protein